MIKRKCQKKNESTDFSYSSREASTAWKNSATPSPVTLDTPTDWESETRQPDEKPGGGTNLEMLVKLVQDKAHAIHETVHVSRCTLVVRRALMRCEGFLKRLEISHPLEGKCMRLDIRLVEDHDERKLCLVEDTDEH
jgi:hypothetical protein